MAEPCKGKLVLWNDEKGFGFVRPESAEKDLFIHISAIKNYRKGLSRRPAAGDLVHYLPLSREEAAGHRRISLARVIGLNDDIFGVDAVTGWRWGDLGLIFIAGMPILLSFYLIWRTGNLIPLVSYIFMSALASLYYAADKQRALLHSWRVPEIYLHWFELLGGWPGALLSQKAFRHKKNKGDYQRVFWGIVMLHGILWLIYFYVDFTR